MVWPLPLSVALASVTAASPFRRAAFAGYFDFAVALIRWNSSA
jgi:hypothetical protein